MAIASPGATLRDEQQVIGSIVELMKTEQQLLISADADGLSTITPNKLQLAQRAATLSRVRHKALGAAGFPAGDAGMEPWLAVGGMDEDLWYTADWDLYLKLAAHGSVCIRPETTTAFRLHGSSLTMTGSRRSEDFAAQQDLVLARHLPALPVPARRRQERLARASVAVNCALAARSARQPARLGAAVGALAALGPLGMVRFLRATRLIDRVMPRLRLSMAGGL